MKSLILPTIFFLLIACETNSSKTQEVYEDLNKSLVSSNKIIDQKNRRVILEFEGMLKDPIVSEKAKPIFVKIDSAKNLADTLCLYLEGLKEQATAKHFKQFSDEELHHLFNRIVLYKLNLLNLDPFIASEFDTSHHLHSFTKNASLENAFVRNLYDISTQEVVLIFTQLQNDAKTSEALALDWLNNRISRPHVIYDSGEFASLINTSSQFLKQGQELTITAGMGLFTVSQKPKVSVDGILIPVNKDGIAEYKLNAGPPGKYYKTIEISFTKADGTPATLSKRLEYEVTNCGGVPK